MSKNNCCRKDDEGNEEMECNSPRILSKESTSEILGENLSSLIAIGKDGKPVLFLPFGTDKQLNDGQFSDEESTSLLDITIRVPKAQDEHRHHFSQFAMQGHTFCVCYPPGGRPPYACWR